MLGSVRAVVSQADMFSLRCNMLGKKKTDRRRNENITFLSFPETTLTNRPKRNLPG